MQRCRQTAAAVAPELPPQIDPDLREIDFGQWEKRTFQEAAAADPSLVDRWADFDPDFAFPGGESVGGFLSRVQAAADRLVEAEDGNGAGGHARRRDPHDDLSPAWESSRGSIWRSTCPILAMAVIDLFDGRGVLAALVRPEAAEGGHG